MPGARRRWPRVLLGILIVLLATTVLAAGGAYLWLNDLLGETRNQEQSQQIFEEVLEEEKPTTATTVPGTPKGVNILVMGSDIREEEGETTGRSDTLMLVHVDPERNFISVLSLPRDLRVSIPGYGKNKVNAAFALGGPELAIRTVEQLLGVDLNHYVNIDFEAFRAVTEALGGIYVDVDRDYFPPRYADWEFLDIEPGYQRLAGEDALDYVRFRHDLNGDFGRIERQQRFLRAAKEQAFKWDLAFKVPQLMRLVSQNVETSLGPTDIIELAWWSIRIGQERVKQVTLEAGTDEIGGASYVVATENAIANAAQSLFFPPAKTLPSTTTTEEGDRGGEAEAPESTTTTTAGRSLPDLRGVTVDVLNGNGRAGEGAAAARFLRSLGASVDRITDAPSYGQPQTSVSYPAGGAGAAALVAEAVNTDVLEASSKVRVVTVTLGMDFKLPHEPEGTSTLPAIPDSGTWKSLAAQASFKLMAPGVLPEAYVWADRRMYEIATEDGSQPALKVIYKLKREDQYLGIMETTFTDAPAAAGGEELKEGDLTFHVVYHDDKVDRVWWKKDGVVYWISNTLSYRLDREDMLAVARSMVDVR